MGLRFVFDELYGKGALDELKALLTFVGIEVEVWEGQDTIHFIWEDIGHCDIRIIDDHWVFQHLLSSEEGMVKFLCSVLPKWALDHGVAQFDVYPDEDTKDLFLYVGLVDEGTKLVSPLQDAKLEQYGATYGTIEP